MTNRRLPALLGLCAGASLGALSRSIGLPGFWAKYLGGISWACFAYFDHPALSSRRQSGTGAVPELLFRQMLDVRPTKPE